jgi:hypothetical protein
MQLQLDAQHFAHAMPAYEKIRELENDLAAAEAANAGPTCPVIGLPDGPIVFSGVSFVHDAAAGSSGSAGGVRDLDLIIELGSIVGIAGPQRADSILRDGSPRTTTQRTSPPLPAPYRRVFHADSYGYRPGNRRSMPCTKLVSAAGATTGCSIST